MFEAQAHSPKAGQPGFVLDSTSQAKLACVHPDLARVVRAAAARCDQRFIVFEGARSVERERSLIARGASALKNPFRCRHVPTKDAHHPEWGPVSHAVDLVPLAGGKPVWDWKLIPAIARAMKAAALSEHVSIEWGGDWRVLRDGPHYQLPFALYP